MEPQIVWTLEQQEAFRLREKALKAARARRQRQLETLEATIARRRRKIAREYDAACLAADNAYEKSVS